MTTTWDASVQPFVNVRIDTLDALTGDVLTTQTMHNLVVQGGLNQLRDAVYGDTIVPPTRFAIGTGTTAVSGSQTALVNEVWRDVFTTKTKSSAQVEIKYFLTSTTANGNTLAEAGLFSTSDTMYARVVFTDTIPKTSSVAVLFVWTLGWSPSA